MAKKTLAVKKSRAKPAAPAVAGSRDPFGELRTRVDQMFDDFGRGWGFPGKAGETRGFAPMAWPFAQADDGLLDVKVEVSETDKDLQIDAELPGLEDKDVEVTMSDDVLTIKGEKRVESEKQEKDYHLSERRYGSFTRSFRVPNSVDDTTVKARFDKGVLKIRMSKKPDSKAAKRKIEVSAG